MGKHRRERHFSPLTAALLFAVLAAAWIALSAILLQANIHDPAVAVQLELASAMGFVLFASALLYLILRRSGAPQVEPSEKRRLPTRRLLPLLIAVIAAVPAIMAVVAYFEAPWLREDALKELRAISTLKSRQIENWLDERYADAETLTNDPGFNRLVQQASKGDASAREVLRQRLEAFRQAYHYRSINILPRGGKLLFQAHSGMEDQVLWQQLPLESMADDPGENRSALRYHIDSQQGVHLFISRPLKPSEGETESPGLLLLHIAPEHFLYPYITAWPTPSDSGETLLATRDGESVLFLTPLRHMRGEPGTITHSLSDPELPAAVALKRGTAGTFSGRDYRNEEVLAAHQPIPGTGWQLIAKRDRDEVMEPLYILLSWIGVITLTAVIVLALLLLHLWRQQQRIHQLEIRAERRRADSLVRQFFDLPFIGIAITDPASKRWQRFNGRLCDILGYSRDQLEAMTWTELTHPEDLNEENKLFDEVMQGNRDGYCMDKRFIHKDGHTLDAYVDVKAIRSANGKLDHLVAMLQDISERKAAEQVLRDSETRFRAVFDTVTDGILMADVERGRFVMGNSAIETMLGYSHEQLIQLQFDDIHPADTLADVHEKIEQQIRGESSLAADLPVLRSDGSVFYADINSAPLTLHGKQYLVGVFRDTTERKQAQEALDSTRRRAQHYLDIAGTMIIALDLEGHITLANRRACELLGYDEEELLGRNWFECCLPASLRDEVMVVFNRLHSANNEELEYFENPVVCRSGEERLIAWHNVLLRDSEDRINGILSSGEDITERRQAERRLVASETRLRTLVDTLPDLVWLKDVEGNYLACNPQFERFFGAREAEIVGKTDYDFVDKELADFFRDHDRKAMAAEKPSRNEETLTFANDGYTGTFETVKTPMHNSTGELIGVLGIARDITQRKRQVAHIERLSRLYKTLSHTNKAIVHSTNQEELFQQVCRSAVGNIGFKHAWIALLGDDGRTLQPQTAFSWRTDGSIEERDAEQLLALVQRQNIIDSLQKNTPLWCDEERCTLTPWNDNNPTPMENAGLTAILPIYRRNRLVGAFGLTAEQDYALDQNARELLLEMATDIGYALDNFELQRQQRIAEEAMRQSASAITILDPELNFIYTNHAFTELFGYTSDEAKQNTIALIAPPPDVATLHRSQIKEQVDRHHHYRGELIRRHKDGELIPVYISAAALFDHNDKLIGYVSSYNDMRALKQSERRLRQALTDTITAISHTIEKRDPYTAGHQERVAELAVAIAHQMGLDTDRVEGIYLGSLIHDIGKIYIPSEILNRPGKLSEYEFGLIKSHPEVGYEIIKDVQFDWPIPDMVYQHHERIDGSGYPQGLKGEEICLEAKIIAIADIVEAMTSHRPYRPGLGLEPALAQIEQEAGTTLDGEIVACCLKLFHEGEFTWGNSFTERS